MARVRVTINRQQAMEAVRPEATRIVARATAKVAARANVLTPVDTGRLRAANASRIRQLKRRVQGQVYNNTKYASAVHEGAAPHVIRPRKRKALKFTKRGKVIFAAKVNHPGNRGRPWLWRALQGLTPDGWKVQRRRRRSTGGM